MKTQHHAKASWSYAVPSRLVGNSRREQLDRYELWSEFNQVDSSVTVNCYCSRWRGFKLEISFEWGNTSIGTTVKQKDLRVAISADMKVSEQCGIAASNCNNFSG